jgi:hypothetical protein
MIHSIADVQPPLRVDIRYNNLNNGNKIQASDMQFELLDKRAHFENDLSTAGLSSPKQSAIIPWRPAIHGVSVK